MNALFFIVFLVGGAALLFINPEQLFSAMLAGGEKAALLCAKLLAIYAVSMGILKVMEDCNLMQKLSNLLRPINKRLFFSDDEQTSSYISANISANILGIGGIATPMGIKAVDALSKRRYSHYTTSMFFVLNAASLQLLPLSVIALRSSYGSLSSSDIILPSLLCSAVCTLCGFLLVKIFIKKK